jgi:hypothetical protein
MDTEQKNESSELVAEREEAPVLIKPGATAETSLRDFRILWRAVAAGSILLIIIYWASSQESMSEFFIFDVFYYALIIEIIIFIWVGLGLRQAQGRPILLRGRNEAAKVGLLAGFILGFILAIFKLVWYYKLWTAFNLITEPVTTAILGFLVSGVTGRIGRKR